MKLEIDEDRDIIELPENYTRGEKIALLVASVLGAFVGTGVILYFVSQITTGVVNLAK